MAVAFTYDNPNNYLWSIKSPMFIYWEKTSGTEDTNITIDITQGSYTKQLELKYSGLIASNFLNVANLVKNYFQHPNFASLVISSNKYNQNQTMQVVITVEDLDNSVTTTQAFINNTGYNSWDQSGGFGPNNKGVAIPVEPIFEGFARDITYNLYKGNLLSTRPILNWPLQVPFKDASSVPAPVTDFWYVFTVYSVPGGTGTQTFNTKNLSVENDRIFAILLPNVPQTPQTEINGAKVQVDVYVNAEGDDILYNTFNIIYNYKDYCLVDNKTTVLFEALYGGEQQLTFTNNVNTLNRQSKDFTLYDGSNIRLDETYNYTGVLTSEFLNQDDAELYKALFTSKNICMIKTEYNTTFEVPIILSNPRFVEKQINGVKMVQYTFNYKEVNRAKL